jgi:hypothetical protein
MKIATLLFTFILILSIVNANIIAKTIIYRIKVTYNNEKVSDPRFDAVLLQCETKNETEFDIPPFNIKEFDEKRGCTWQPTFPFGSCGNSECSFLYIPKVEEVKLAIYIPSLNKVFISNEFSTGVFYGNYKANILLNGSIEISEIPSLKLNETIWTFIYLIITPIPKLLVGFIYINFNKANIQRYRKKQNKILFTIFLSDLLFTIFLSKIALFFLSILLYIFLKSADVIPPLIILILFPVNILLRVFFDGFFIKLLNKDVFTFKNALVFSIVINIVGYLIAEAILFLYTVYISPLLYLLNYMI